jgi:hypothetical protein
MSAPRQMIEGQTVQLTIGIPVDIYTNGFGTFDLTLWKFTRFSTKDYDSALVSTIAS